MRHPSQGVCLGIPWCHRSSRRRQFFWIVGSQEWTFQALLWNRLPRQFHAGIWGTAQHASAFFIEPIIYQQDFKVSTLCARDSETHSKLRYGIELQIETGRACDISKHSQRQPYSYQETLGRSFKSQ